VSTAQGGASRFMVIINNKETTSCFTLITKTALVSSQVKQNC
jgi:hypothetical protein